MIALDAKQINQKIQTSRCNQLAAFEGFDDVMEEIFVSVSVS